MHNDKNNNRNNDSGGSNNDANKSTVIERWDLKVRRKEPGASIERGL